MPPLTLQLDPASLARLGDAAARIKCPACGQTCTREERAGTERGRRVQVQCAYCEFGQQFEIPAGGAAIAVEPDAADRYRPGTDPISTLPRKACLVSCGRLATDGGFCEPCNRAWRIAGRPEPRDQWAIHYADQLDADRAKTGTPRRARRTHTNTKEADMPYSALPTQEKKRWAYVKKVVPGLDIEQWIADGKPKPAHYRKAAKAAPKAPSKPVQRPVETASTPAMKQPAAPHPLPRPQALILGEGMKTTDPLADLAGSIIATAAKRGGRCRVMILDLTLDGDSEG